MPRVRRRAELSITLFQAANDVLHHEGLYEKLGISYEQEGTISEPPGMIRVQIDALQFLLGAGCSKKVILSGAFILAHPAKTLRVSVPAELRDAETILKSITLLRKLLDASSATTPEEILPAKAQAIRDIPNVLTEYAQAIKARRKQWTRISRGSLLRTMVARKIGEHIRSKTGHYHDIEVCHIVQAFQSAEEKRREKELKESENQKGKKTKVFIKPQPIQFTEFTAHDLQMIRKSRKR